MADNEAKISIVADASKVAPGAQEAKAKLSEIGEQARALNGQFSSLAEFLKQAFQVSVAQSAALKQEVASLAPTLSAIETKLGEMTSALGAGFATLSSQLVSVGGQTQAVTQQASTGAEALRQDMASVSPAVLAVTTSMAELGATVRSSFSASTTASDELLKALGAGFEVAAAKATASTQEIVSAISKVETELKAASAASTALGDRLVDVLRRPAPAAEETGQSISKLENRTQALIKVIDPAAAEQQKWNAFLREAKALLDAGAISTEQYAHAQQVAEKALKDGGVSAGQMKFAMRDLSYNISDVTTSLAGGINPMMIFAQQGNQIVGAIQLMKGESSAFVNFLAGPWGAAIMGAIGFIGVLASKHEEAASAEKDHASAADQLKAALERLNNAAAENNHQTRLGIQADIDAARQARDTAKAQLDKARANLVAAQSTERAGYTGTAGNIGIAGQGVAAQGAQIKAIGDQIADLDKKMRVGRAQIILRDVSAATDKAHAATKAYEDGLDKLQRQFESGALGAGKQAEDRFRSQATALTKTRDAALDAARVAKSGNTAELDAQAKLATADTAAERARAQLTLTRIKAREELKAGTITAEQYLARVSAAEGAVQDATAKKPKKQKSRLGDWETSLDEQKLALAELADNQSNFREMSLREEANYWDAIRKRSDLSHEERNEVEKKYFAITRAMRKDQYDAYIADLTTKLEAARGNAPEQIRIVDQIVAAAKGKYEEDSKEYQQALQKKLQVQRQIAAEEVRVAQQTAQAKLRLQEQQYQDRVGGIQFRTDLGLQSPAQEIKARIAAEQDQWGQQQATINTEISQVGNNPDALRNALNQKFALEQQHQNRLTNLTRQAVLQRTALERNAIGSVAQSWGQNIGRMLTLQQSFGATVQGLWQGLVGAVGNAIGQMLEQWIAMQLTKLIIGGATEKATAASTISAEAAKAGAGGTASMAAAPFPLNLGAPAFGASMAAAAASYAALVAVPSAEGGWWEVPGGGAGIDGKGGQLGIVHPKEMVLPAGLASPLRDMVAGGGAPATPANDIGSRPAGDTYHLHFNGPTNKKQIEKWLADMGSGVLTAAKRGVRNNGSPF